MSNPKYSMTILQYSLSNFQKSLSIWQDLRKRRSHVFRFILSLANLKNVLFYFVSLPPNQRRMDELTHLTNYFTESSRVLRTHGTREKVTNNCVKFVKSVKCATEFGDMNGVCRNMVVLSQQLETKSRKKFGTSGNPS